MAGRAKGLVFAAVLIVAAMGLALGVAELVVRQVAPQKLAVNVTQWDPDVGFVNIPGATGYSEREDYQMWVRINSRGLRDREFDRAKPPRTIRIGVFGDSFTFGEGVQNDETYAKRLEEALAGDPALAATGARVEVLNFGIGKTGTSHQLAWYRKEGRLYGLDVVVLGFFGNDWYENVAGVYILNGDRLVHNPTAYSTVRRIQRVVMAIPFYSWAARNSHLVNMARVAATLYDDKRRIERAQEQNSDAVPAPEEPKDVVFDRMYRMTATLVRALRDDVQRDGARFVFMSLPQLDQKPLEQYGPSDERNEAVPLLDRLQRELRAEGTDVLDLVAPFAADAGRRGYYLPLDGHFNAAGHRQTGRLLAAHLRPLLLDRGAAVRSAAR